MPVRFILGRAGMGKTRHCLDALLDGLARTAESSKLILLVPEQASFQMERALALRAPSGGFWRAEVLSFSRLARRVFEQLGGPMEELSPQARRMALRLVAAGCERAVAVFGKAAKTAGFYAQLDTLIEELLGENVSPEALRRGGMQSGDLQRQGLPDGGTRVEALSDIYERYLEWLGQRVDPATRLAAFRERLERVDWLGDARIWVDGFAGFTGQELETLIALARRAKEMEITLLLDPDGLHEPRAGEDNLRLFVRTERTYQRLRSQMAGAAIELRPPLELNAARARRFVASRELEFLERRIGGIPAGTAPPCTKSVRILECGTHREELRAAARFIRTTVIDSRGAARFRDFAVIVRDLAPIAYVVAEVFDEFEIPYFVDRRRALGSHALCRLVRCLLEAAISDCARDTMVRLLQCGMMLERCDAEEIENVVLASEVHGLEAWRRQWDFGPQIRLPAGTENARRRIVRSVEGLHALAHHGVVDRVSTRPSVSGSDWVRQLFAAIEESGAARRLEAWIAEAQADRRFESAETHRLAWESLCEVLDDVHSVLGDTALTAGEFSEAVNESLAELTLGLAPPTLDQVLVGSIERSRHPEIKYAWLMAFNEGIFPRPPAEDGLLPAADRELLAAAGLEALRPRREDVLAEQMLAYIAYTRASQGMTISFARTGVDGQALSPSSLLADIRLALPGIEIEPGPAAGPPACAAEFAREYLKSPRSQDLQGLRARLSAAFGDSTLNWLLRGVEYDNAAKPLALSAPCRAGALSKEPETAARVESNAPSSGRIARQIVWRGSPSQVETYIQCPFKHFAEHRLGLKVRRGPRPVEWDLGELAHDVLADVTRRAMLEAGSVHELSDVRWIGLLDEAIAHENAGQPADLANRRPRASFLRGATTYLLRETVLAHAERWRQGRFEPFAVERAFCGIGAEADGWPALEIELERNRVARLEVRIDRIDAVRDADGTMHLLVYDYKSSVVRLDEDYLTGARLASFAYLLAVQRAFGGARVAGALIAPLYCNAADLQRRYASRAGEDVQRLIAFRPRGVFDEHAAAFLDPELARRRKELLAVRAGGGAAGVPAPPPSAVAAIRITKDGEFYADSDVRSEADLVAHCDLARKSIHNAVTSLVAGEISVAPLVENRTLACNACDFKSLCRFDPMLNRPRAAERHLPQLGVTENKEETKSANGIDSEPE
jgi:ATP-dependent helicase/nuclease subunit B